MLLNYCQKLLRIGLLPFCSYEIVLGFAFIKWLQLTQKDLACTAIMAFCHKIASLFAKFSFMSQLDP